VGQGRPRHATASPKGGLRTVWCGTGLGRQARGTVSGPLSTAPPAAAENKFLSLSLRTQSSCDTTEWGGAACAGDNGRRSTIKTAGPVPGTWEMTMTIRSTFVKLALFDCLAVGLARKSTYSLFVIALATITILQPAAARPKGPDSTCTTADIKTPGGQACVKKQEDDLAHNRPYSHYLICLNDGAHSVCGAERCCCQKGHGCTAAVAPQRRINPGLLHQGPGFSRQGHALTGAPVAPPPPTRGPVLR